MKIINQLFIFIMKLTHDYFYEQTKYIPWDVGASTALVRDTNM